MTTKIWAALLFCFLLALHTAAQPNTPFLFSAVNSASYDRSAIAQGSLFVVFGQNIGPAQIVQAGSFPLPAQIGGTAITVSSGSTTLNCPMVYSLAGQAAAILPSNTPAGQATLMLTYNGVHSPQPVSINVVPAAPGIYTLSSSGFGPGVFTALDNSVNTFAATAKAGDTVTAWATGLGPIGSPDNVLPLTFPNFSGVEVFVGTQAAKVIYAGRSGCCSGVDQVSFVIPGGIAGCYMPVSIRSAGRISNFVTIAVAGNGSACSDTGPTVPTSVFSRAIGGQPVKTALIAIGPITYLHDAGFNKRQFVAETLSKVLHVTVSEQDAAMLLRALEKRNQRAAIRTMAKYAAAWKALDAAAKADLRAQLSSSQEGAAAAFGQFSRAGMLASAIGSVFPSLGSCVVPPLSSGLPGSSSGSSSKNLDAGPSLSLSGQVGSWTLTSTSPGQYQVVFGSTPAGPNVPPGTYTLTGSAGKDVGAFSATLNIGGNIVWTNKSAISTIDRGQPLTIAWSGGTTPGYVLLGGYSENNSEGPSGFLCTEDASKGSFTIPSFVLSALSPTTTKGVMFIGPHPLSRQVTIPGIDLAYFADVSSDSMTVTYK